MVEFNNCIFNSNKIIHNILNVYCFENNATVTFNNCKFLNLNSNCNPIRFDNITNANNILITFNLCKWSYHSIDNNIGWLALILLQPGNNFNDPIMSNWKIIIKDCMYNSNSITIETFSNYEKLTTKYQTNLENANSILYYYTNRLLDPSNENDKKYFPSVKIINGENSKIYSVN